MRIARALLPWVAVAALLITLAIPLMVPDDPDFDAFHITSAGERGSDAYLLPMLLIWGVVLVAAVTAWIGPWPALWSVPAFLAALAMFMLPLVLALDPPFLLWDGWDEANNRPAGGMVAGRPSFGSAVWVLGSFALSASGLLGIIEAVLAVLRRGARGRDGRGISSAPAAAGRPPVQGPPAAG